MLASLVDFCESTFTESWDREWDLSRKFLRVENENESSKGFFESREWEWECSRNFLRVENENESSQGFFWELRMRMRVLMKKLRVEIENETLNFSRMRAYLWELRVRMRLSNFWEWETIFLLWSWLSWFWAGETFLSKRLLNVRKEFCLKLIPAA